MSKWQTGTYPFSKTAILEGDEYVATAESPEEAQRVVRLLNQGEAMREALAPIVRLLKVVDNHGPALFIDDVPMFRPIEGANRDRLGTLFTLLFNAKVAIDAALADNAKQEGTDG